MPILRDQFVEVMTRGELVVLAIGNVSWSMEFHFALRVAAELQMAGRIAKQAAGDESRRYRVLGSLTNATPDDIRVSRFVRTLPTRLQSEQVGATICGTQVRLRLGRTTAVMPYENALQLAGWLRVRGKEARNRSGEKAHWSKIANTQALNG